MDAAPGRRRSLVGLVPVLAVAGVVVLVDQLTKEWALATLVDRDIDLVWTLRLNLAFNTGSAFSFGSSIGPVLGVVALLVVGVLLWMGRLGPDLPTSIALGAVAGGALGNIVDRAFRSPRGESDGGFLGGAVVDFIDLQWWPIFNVADMAIVLGGIALVVLTSRRDQPAG